MGAKDIDYDFVVEKYWNTNPAWSGLDLINYYGCSRSSLYRFMERNDIPRRNQSEAHINAWKNEQKKENTLKARKDPEFIKKASERMTKLNEENWKNPEWRKKQIEAIKKSMNKPEVKKRISEKLKEIYYNTDSALRKLNERKKGAEQ